MALLMAGCIPIINKPSYPVEWPSAATERIGACPAITGKYVNHGQLYIEAGIKCPPPSALEGRWSCDLELGPNLGIASPAVTVEIAQPDAETMNVQMLDRDGVAREMRTLHLNEEYQCDAETLYFSATGSAVMGKALSGALLQHRRAFVRDTKGELVMTVRDDIEALMAFIGILKSDVSYVRWTPAGTAAPASANGQ